MALTQERLEYQREYRKRTGNAAEKKYYNANKEACKARSRAWQLDNPLKLKKHIKRAQTKRATDLTAFANHAFAVIKSRAKKDGRGLKITATYLKTLLQLANKTCQVTGLPVSYNVGDVHKASFDRIDNNKGYVYGNLQVVSSYINYAKQEHSQAELFKVAKAIVEHNNL